MDNVMLNTQKQIQNTSKTYRRLGIFLIIAPFAGMIFSVFAYLILSFVFAFFGGSEFFVTLVGVIRVLLGFIGLASVLGLFVAIPIGIYLFFRK